MLHYDCMPDVFTDKPTQKPSTEPKVSETYNPISIMAAKENKPGFFTAFSPKPIGLSFATQEPEEQILLLLRKHFITNIPWVLTIIFFILISFLLLPFLRSDTFSSVFFIPDSYLIVLGIFYYLLLLGYALQQFATWFYQVGIITSFRVVDIDFHTLMSRNVAYTDVIDIVDVEITQGGFLHNFFDYGTVHMQTEGLKANFEFVNIPNPHVVADTINDLMRLKKEGKE